MPVALILTFWVAWTLVACDAILDSEHPLVPQRLLWCAVQIVLPFLGWPLYLFFGTGYVAALDAELWPHRHQSPAGVPLAAEPQ